MEPSDTPQKKEAPLASDLVKYLRMRTQAEQFRKERPKLDGLIARLFNEDRTVSELSHLEWDIPTL